MKTIDELAQVLLTVDNRLDLVLLGDSNTGLTVDDDMHRELHDAVKDRAEQVELMAEVVLDDGGYFIMFNEAYVLKYTYNEDETVTWSYEEKGAV